jgi:hypothetical protein
MTVSLFAVASGSILPGSPSVAGGADSCPIEAEKPLMEGGKNGETAQK